MYIRDAEASDLTAIVDIYNQSIPDRLATADTEPIAVASRLDWYRNRPLNRPLWVAIKNEQVAGWLSFQNFYGRPAYLHTAEISIYVANQFQRQGIGSKLLARAIARSPQLQLTTLLGFIFAHNQPSLNLFIRYAFSQWGYLPDLAVLDGVERSLVILGRKISETV
ncbi:MAG: GNAT family N-acetyltransferase [Pleurocapsa sp. MO_226.B13]|nr:GNAT family N-acetyltransferase [Pleurocapsa sp. MO_226.B13]